jgi:hypothetical protein
MILIDILVIFVGLLVVLFIGLMVGIHVYVYTGIWKSNRVLGAQLRQQNRVISLKEARNRIKKGEGIILADAPTLGWNVKRIWWSSRDDFCPRSERTDDSFCLEGDVENHARFIDTATGSACLIDGFVFRAGRYLQKHFGITECPYIFTGGVLAQQRYEEMKLEKDTSEDRTDPSAGSG